jgi:hypothetical protein
MEWAKRVAVTGEKEDPCMLLVGIPEIDNCWEHIGVDGAIKLKLSP